MYTVFFQALAEHIQDTYQPKHIDWWNEQPEKHEEIHAHDFPAVYIEFGDPLTWEDSGSGEQQSEAEIHLHLVVFDLVASPVSAMAQAQLLHAVVQDVSLEQDGNQIENLTRIRTELRRYTQCKEVILSYEATLTDRSLAPRMVPAEPELRLNHRQD